MEHYKQSLTGVRKLVFFKDGEVIKIQIMGRKKPIKDHAEYVAGLSGESKDGKQLKGGRHG